jgi:hypothetical protein
VTRLFWVVILLLLVSFYAIILLYTASYSTETLANLLSNRTYSATLWHWLENEVVAHILEQDEL